MDYRRLNALTIRDTYPLPRTDDYLDSLADVQFFTTLDCKSGYWQLPIAEKDRQKTAFVSHASHYQWVRMSVGLMNAPASVERTVDIILSRFRWKSYLVYLDEVIILSKSLDDHLRQVRDIHTTLREAGLSLNLWE